MTCGRQTWVGAYVLDALEPDENESLRLHIAECEICQDEVVSLSWIPAMLRMVELEGVQALDDEPAADGRSSSPMLERLLSSMHTTNHARRQRRPLVLLAAAALVLAIAGTAAVVGGLFDGGHRAPVQAAIKAVDPRSHADAAVTLIGRSWGTELQLKLSWVEPGQHCSLIARSRDGHSDVAATWIANYQGTANVPGTTAIPIDKLTELDVVGANGRQLVQLVVPHKAK